MKRNSFVKTKLLTIFCLLLCSTATAFAQLKSGKAPIYSSEKQYQTRDLTGTYLYKGEGRLNKIKVLRTGADEIKVSFEGIYQFKIPGGHLNTRTGDIEPETIRLEKRRAVLTSEDAPDCRVTLTFLNGGRLKAMQSASGCGFPDGVTADGVYRKTSRKKPQFLNYSDDATAATLENAADKMPESPPKRVRFRKGTTQKSAAAFSILPKLVFRICN